MNVVGKVGSLITQGVYSVATPFHPFGGAVDVIVVKQLDGTFRSTPWYVRFGKFQGVLKGAEKIVRISVNGVEANFHMYLDNSGEAYFVKEVDVGRGNENGVSEDSRIPEFSSINGDKQHNSNEHVVDIRRLDHSVSDSEVGQLQEECESFGEEGIERAESDGERRFYEFQDVQSSLDGSVDLSDYGSTRYENLDGENIVESQNLDSEVVLVSVDGHILTAPITASEQNTDNLQLSTPQFHLGPGEGTEFCDGSDELSSDENGWAVDYFSKLNASSTNDESDNISGVNNDSSALGHQLVVCEGEEEHVCQVTETQNIAMTEGNVQVHSDSQDVAEVEKEEVFKNSSDNQVTESQNFAMTDGNIQVHSDSEDVVEVKKEEVIENSSELSELPKQVEGTYFKDLGLSSEVHSSTEAHQTVPLDDGTEGTGAVFRNNDGSSSSYSAVSVNNNLSMDKQCQCEQVDKNADGAEDAGVDDQEGRSLHSIGKNSEWKNEQSDTSGAVVIGGTPERPTGEDESTRNGPMESPTTSTEALQTHSNTSKQFFVALIIYCGLMLKQVFLFINLAICRF